MADFFDKETEECRCSFCFKPREKSMKLVAGPNGSFICEECIEICKEILDSEKEKPNSTNI